MQEYTSKLEFVIDNLTLFFMCNLLIWHTLVNRAVRQACEKINVVLEIVTFVKIK